MEQHQCPVCKNAKYKKLKNYTKHFLCKCTKCKFVFSYLIPEENLLDSHYEHYGQNSYVSPITIKRYDDLLKKFEKFRSSNKILDYGCGFGYFLECAQKRGWDAYGVETGEKSIAVCKEKGITLIDPSENNIITAFDIIVFSEVIEHLTHPANFIKLFHELLRTEGLLYITTPNFNSISRRIVRNKWNVLTYPEHLSYFTPKTLKRILHEHRFKSINTKTHGVSLSRIKVSLKKERVSSVYKYKTDEKLRELAEERAILRFVKKIVNFSLNIFRLGDTIKCFAIKK